MGQPRKKRAKPDDEGVSGDQLSQVADAMEGKTTFGKLGAEGEIDETADDANGANGHTSDAEWDGAAPHADDLSPLKLDIETLRGDIATRFMDDIVRRMEKPWTKLESFQQQNIIMRVDNLSRSIVRRSVHMLAHAGFPVVSGVTGKIQFGEKGVLELKFKATDNVPNITALAQHGRGAEAILVLCETSEYMGAREEQKADLDQPDLPLGGAAKTGESDQEDLPLDGEAAHDPETGEINVAAQAPPEQQREATHA